MDKLYFGVGGKVGLYPKNKAWSLKILYLEATPMGKELGTFLWAVLFSSPHFSGAFSALLQTYL